MSDGTILLIAMVAVVGLGVLFVSTTAARRDRVVALRAGRGGGEAKQAPARTGREVEQAAHAEREADGGAVAIATKAPPAMRGPMEPEVLDVTRRQFLNRGITAFFGFGLAGFGAAALGFLWPSLSGGFGSKINVGKVDEILEEIKTTRKPKYVAEARSWIAPFPREAMGKAQGVYSGAVLEGMKEGFVALYQKCPHLGCRVPFCDASQWFECPCHGSKYNRVGEKKGGPAPRGMDRFGINVSGGALVVDTQQVVQGPAIGTDTTGQGAEGPHCA